MERHNHGCERSGLYVPATKLAVNTVAPVFTLAD